MWQAEHVIETQASTEAVWARLAAVDAWSKWDADVRWARLDGPLAEGVRGRIKSRGGPSASFAVTELIPQRRLVDVTRLPLVTMTFMHELEPNAGWTRLTHRVVIDGPLSAVFGRIVGRKVAAGLPVAMRRLAALAEQPASA